MANDIISNRQHSFLKVRATQIGFNVAAANGGRPYIDLRLWRAPNETDKQWNGDPTDGTVGRKERTAYINDAGRVVSKINQYIFKKTAERTGIDEGFRGNVTGDGETIDAFMERVNTAITTGRWCWVQVDRKPAAIDPLTGQPKPRTLASKKANKDFVTWKLWDANSVTDWYIDETGVIRWLITCAIAVNKTDPLTEEQKGKVYTLYFLNPEDNKVHITETCDNEKLFAQGELRSDFVTDLDFVPFVLVGRPTDTPWWFDDVENISAQLLNLDSLHNESLTDSVYPQLVAPMSTLNSLETSVNIENLRGEELITLQREVIKGRRNPFFESAEDRGITRYITPSSQELKALTDEQSRKRAVLFDMCGLALFNKESRQAQTAESKQFDQLDTNATLGNRALLLQGAEGALVKMSKVFDPTFAEYTPVYPNKFDVVDITAMRDVVSLVANTPNATTKMRKIALVAVMRLLLETGGCDQQQFDEAREEIEKLTDADFETANPFELPKEDDDDPDDPDKNKGGNE